MKFWALFREKSIRGVGINLGAMVLLLSLISLTYFYIYLPSTTAHGRYIFVPELTGLSPEEATRKLEERQLRLAIYDSSYEEEAAPLSVLKQFPEGGSKVKANRLIYVTINRFDPPTLPMPDVLERSLINAEAVLRSNELRRGRIIYEPSPFRDFVREIRYAGRPILPGQPVPKGAVIDIVVGDGNGPADFTLQSLLGDSYKTALLKLASWNLLLGDVNIPAGIDTTGLPVFVFKQAPEPGDSVRIGDAVSLWIAPRGYKPVSEDDMDDPDNR